MGQLQHPSSRAFTPSLQFKLFPRSSPNPTECMHETERSKNACTLIHEWQRFQNKADGLYLTTPEKAELLRFGRV